jgi:hypothetical protein
VFSVLQELTSIYDSHQRGLLNVEELICKGHAEHFVCNPVSPFHLLVQSMTTSRCSIKAIDLSVQITELDASHILIIFHGFRKDLQLCYERKTIRCNSVKHNQILFK